MVFRTRTVPDKLYDPESKGGVERTNRSLETSFLPGKSFASQKDFNVDTRSSIALSAGLKAGLGKKCINHHKEVGAMIRSIRVGNVLNCCPVIDHQK